MSSVPYQENEGLKSPYRTLLILFWGMLMALAALAGQLSGSDDFLPNQASGSAAKRPRIEQVQILQEKPARTNPF